MKRLLLAALASGGCQVVFPLDATAPDDPCPPATPGANEDGDDFDDEVDNCPSIRNDSQADTDGDGIGDSCDVRPDTADRSCFFGFNDPGELDRMDVLSMDWQISNGALVQPVSKSRDGVAIQQDFRTAAIIVSARSLTDPVIGTARIGAVVSGSDLLTDAPHGITCGIEHRGAQGPQMFLLDIDNLLAGKTAAVVAGDQPIAIALTVADVDTNKPHCLAGDGGTGAELDLDAFAPEQVGQAAVFVENGTVEITSIQVIFANP